MRRHMAVTDISSPPGVVHRPRGNCVFPESEGIVQNNTDDMEIEGKPSETFTVT